MMVGGALTLLAMCKLIFGQRMKLNSTWKDILSFPYKNSRRPHPGTRPPAKNDSPRRPPTIATIAAMTATPAQR